MKKAFLTLCAVALALVACNKPAELTNSREIRFTTNLDTYATKAAVEENILSDVKIIAGAPINVTASATPAQTGLAGTLTTSPVLYWGVGQTESTKFIAITGGQTAAVVDNYDMVGFGSYDYEYCAKLMSAVATAAPEETVALNFEHIFSKVNINIVNNLGEDSVASVELKNIATSATVNFETRAITNLGEQTSTLPANENTANALYEVVIIPQTAQPTITVTTAQGAVYNFVLSTNFTFQRAKVASVTLTLNPATSASVRTPVGTMSFTVADWSDDATAMSGNGTMDTSAYWQIFGKVYSTADKDSKPGAWEKRYPLTYEGSNLWTVDINCDSSMEHSDNGLLFVKGDTYLGMWNGSENIGDGTGYDLKTDERANIILPSDGKYRFSLLGVAPYTVTYTRLGDCE